MNSYNETNEDQLISNEQADAIAKQSVTTQDHQKRMKMIMMHRQFEDRTNKMRMDLLSMKKTASNKQANNGSSSSGNGNNMDWRKCRKS